MVAAADEEGCGFRLCCFEDNNRFDVFTVEGDVQIGDVDVGAVDGREDAVEIARGIVHFYGDNLVVAALVAFLLQRVHSDLGIVDNQTHDAEFGTVVGEHGVDIDISFC